MAAEYDLKVWRVNVRTQTVTKEPVPASWERLGGRGLLARILLDEVEPTCEPLGPKNKLVFAPGLLVGHMLSATDRLSVGAKSPMSGGFRESNSGGSTALHMTSMGIKALESTLAPYDLYTADECFLTGTGAEIVPVIKIDGRTIGNGRPGTVTKSLIEAFRESIA